MGSLRGPYRRRMPPPRRPWLAATIRLMTDRQVPPQYPRPDGQRDTNVLSWPRVDADDHAGHGPEYVGSGAPASDGGYPGAGYTWAPPASVGGAEAAYWESRFRRQRTWTRFLGATIAAGLLLFVGGGLFVWNVVIPRAASTVSQGLTDSLAGPAAPDSDSAKPGGGTPDPAPEGGTGQGPAPQGLSDVPLPEQLRGLGSMLGIDNVDDLLDTAVSMGLMSQEQADRIREVVAAGGSLQGLLGSGGQSELGSPDPGAGSRGAEPDA